MWNQELMGELNQYLFLQEISQQLMLERRAKKKSMNSYNKMADVENKKGVYFLKCDSVMSYELLRTWDVTAGVSPSPYKEPKLAMLY